ncbi:MAG: hypothetical protein ACYDAY_11930 [Candidatus Dormibacteria bacterium]
MTDMTPQVYLAARFGRQQELRAVAGWLRTAGYLCDPTWLRGGHDLPLDVAPDDPRGAQFAQEDLRDLLESDIVICFTEEPGVAGRARGGRHVEMGIAIGTNKRVIVVGPRENVFCWLPFMERYSTWSMCRSALSWVHKDAPALSPPLYAKAPRGGWWSMLRSALLTW